MATRDACEGHCPAKEALWQERHQDLALANFLQEDLFPHLFHVEDSQARVEGCGRQCSECATAKKGAEGPGPIAKPKFATCGTPPNVRNFKDECPTTCIWCPTTTLKKCTTSPRPNCIPWCDPFLRQASTPGIVNRAKFGTPGIVNKAKFATCPTPINVRNFFDECTSTCLWCPTTKLKKCSTSPRPNCIPWCDPFLKEGDSIDENSVVYNRVKGYVPIELRKYLGRLYKPPSTEFPILEETLQPESQGRYISRFIRSDELMKLEKAGDSQAGGGAESATAKGAEGPGPIAKPKFATCGTPPNVRNFQDECPSTCIWCPTTTLKKCTTSPRPNCIPWCDPFLKDQDKKVGHHVHHHESHIGPGFADLAIATPHYYEDDDDNIYA